MSEKKLKPIIDIIKKEYPGDNELWVEFYTDIPMGVATKINKENEDSIYEAIADVVHDWNFANYDGTELPKTVESIKRLPTSLATWLIDTAIQIIGTDDKKKQ